MMGIVTDYLKKLITKHVDEHGLVVWYDPEGHYRGAAADLSIDRATVVRYDGSYFALRHQVEPLMGEVEPPRLVVYVPVDQSKTNDALIELEAAGVVIAPGQQPPSRNTRLSFIARNALLPVVGEETAISVEKQVEAGKLTLADLDALAEKGHGIAKGVVSVLFGTDNPEEIALRFLASDKLDAELVKKKALAELASLLQSVLGVPTQARESPAEYRARLARYLLSTDLVSHLRGELPSQLATVTVAPEGAQRDSCASLARTWRLRHDLRDSYTAHADRVEKDLGLSGIGFKGDQLVDVDTFRVIEGVLQSSVEAALANQATGDLVERARDRQRRFWPEQLPDVRARWTLIATAGHVILEADRIEDELKSAPPTAGTMFNAYTMGEHPWCLLDSYHRRMERLAYSFDFALDTRHHHLEQLVNKARDRYVEVGSKLAEQFLRALAGDRFRVKGVPRQTETFDTAVRPRLGQGKTAYIWVDALRYDMARDLAQMLSEKFDQELHPALGAVPTITEIGMGALVPGAQKDASVVSVGGGKLALQVQGTSLRDRKDRVAFLKANAGVSVFDVRLDDLLPTPKKKVRDGIAAADLVLVTSQEIDDLCEGDNVSLARRIVDDLLQELRRAVQVLAGLGVETIVMAADHGYLFGEKLGSDMKIDPPGGETLDLHRRVWVGRGGAADPSYLRAKLSDFGLGGDLEVAFPWSFGCFKVKGGAQAYFHGGLSLQELVIPVLTLVLIQKGEAEVGGQVTWTLEPGSPKISTRFFSVRVSGRAAGLFDLAPLRVRLEIRARGERISTAVSASYGFDEGVGDVELRPAPDDPRAIEPNTIALMLTDETTEKAVDLYLLDATGGSTLASLKNIEISIAI